MTKHLRYLCTLLLLAVTSVGWGQTTYKLQQVTEVEAGGLYVFEQDDHVMINTVTSSALQTTSTYSKTGLTGTESYVWELKNGTKGFYISSKAKSSTCITNTSSTGISFNATGSNWKFTFEDGVALIQNVDNSDRFLGYTTATSYAYKAYATSNLSSYPHAIVVYKLVEETISSTTVATPTFDPIGGLYTSAQNVTISTTTANANIYYTIDGTEPTTASTPYTEAIPVSVTTTIKAIAVKEGMENSNVASATYTILEHAGTEADPYTVADARAAIDEGSGTQGVYATGTVSSIVTQYNSQYGNITFDIVDEEGSSVTLRAYRCTGDDAANVQVGDIVVISGNLTKYGDIYEFSDGCTLVSRSSSSTQIAAGLAFSATTASVDLADPNSFTAPTLTNPYDLTITYSSSNTEVATVASDGTVTPLAKGTTTITATSEETSQYLAGEAHYTLTVTNSNVALVTVDEKGNVTFNLSDNGWGFPTSKQVEEGSFTNSGYTIKVAGSEGNGFYFYENGSALLLGKSGAYLTLPEFDFDVEKIEVVGSSGASTSVVQNIFVGETAVSTATTGAQNVTNSYEIDESYQAAGNIYTLKVTSAHNTQITSIKVYKAIVDERLNAEIAFSVEDLTMTQGDEFTPPTFNNPHEVEVTFTTTNADVASWNNGFVLGTATGTATITATFEGDDDYKPATATLVVTVNENLGFVEVVTGCGIYQKITSASDLEAGKRYLIVYENEGTAFVYNGKSGANNYADKVDGTVTNNRIDNTSLEAVPVVLQSAGTDKWFIMDGSTFLYWSSGNSLYWSESAAQEGNTWSINFVENGMSISNVNTPARFLQYNTGSPRFACYTGSQKDVTLFKELLEAPQPEEVKVTISAAATDGSVNYGTLYYSNKNLTVPDGLTAYTASVSNGSLTLSAVTGAIPANTGVVLKTNSKLDENTTFTFTEATEGGTVVAGNMLLGTDGEATTTAPEGSTGTYKFYALSLKAGNAENSVGFYYRQGCPNGEAFTNGKHKAYLAVPVAQAKGMSGFAFGDETDGIRLIENGNMTMENAEIYNLAGQRVNKAQKGIYIVNGKKIVIK